MLPLIIYLLYRRWFLNDNELMMLLTCCLMLFGLLLSGWPCLLIYLTALGYHNLVVLEAARCSQLFSRVNEKSYSDTVEWLFTLSENEIKLLVYLVYFWIVIRAVSLKSLTFDLGNGETVISLMGGWNCTLADFWFLNALWLILILLAALACWFLILNDR